MTDAIFNVPQVFNEAVLNYAPGSPEKIALKSALAEAQNGHRDIAMTIGGKAVSTENKVAITPPHEHKHVIGHFSKGNSKHVSMAVEAALKAKKDWENMGWHHRAAIFLKAADLLSGPYRQKMNASTMLAQSKNAYQSEIDAVAELADFWRFNVQFMTDLYQNQPISARGQWNRLDYRPLEGFVFALTPFNFTSIAANLPTAPALMGNVAVWKPAESQIYSAQIIMDILEEAGLPAGVVNLVFADGPVVGDVVFKHREFAGLHFTGSTGTFNRLWQGIASNLPNYRSYPRIVGETGGKDFIFAHPSADEKALAVAISRGAFEYQGQKCSAASRAYVPKSIWKNVKNFVLDDLSKFKMGSPLDFTNMINAVIDEKAFDKISHYIAEAKKDPKVNIIAGGNYDKSVGYFIEPTLIETSDATSTTMCEEIFGPVMTIYVYDDKKLAETLKIAESTSPYALTGAIFAQDRDAIRHLSHELRHAAGNFYINDKPTGAVVGQQPFGGARGSGTNDKAGSIFNLQRWVSPRNIKENFVPPVDFGYPFLSEK
jgi:1-pyrroline-5-carboxylate dehydrogenase